MRTVDEELDGQGDVFRVKDQRPLGRATYHIVVTATGPLRDTR